MIVSDRQRPDNFSGVFDPELLNLLDKSEETADRAQRLQIYETIQRIALRRAYMIPVALVGHQVAVRRQISGWSEHTDQQIRFTDISKGENIDADE